PIWSCLLSKQRVAERVPGPSVTRTVATSSKAPRLAAHSRTLRAATHPRGESDCGSGLLSKQRVAERATGPSVTRAVATSSKAPRLAAHSRTLRAATHPRGESDCGSGLLSKERLGRARLQASGATDRSRAIER